MATKLTLTVDKSVIDEAKKYAKSSGRSLSNIIEEYLKSLALKQERVEELGISPLVKSLWGSVQTLPHGVDEKEFLADELMKKYLR
jgi:hypothetical protein